MGLAYYQLLMYYFILDFYYLILFPSLLISYTDIIFFRKKMDQFNKLIKPNFAIKDVFPIVSITAAASIVYATYQIFLSQKKVVYRQIPIPGSSYPYVGHMLSLGELPGKTVAKWHDELGPIIRLRMGVQNWIMVNDPILAHKIFVVKGAETSHRPHNTYAHNSGALGEK